MHRRGVNQWKYEGEQRHVVRRGRNVVEYFVYVDSVSVKALFPESVWAKMDEKNINIPNSS